MFPTNTSIVLNCWPAIAGPVVLALAIGMYVVLRKRQPWPAGTLSIAAIVVLIGVLFSVFGISSWIAALRIRDALQSGRIRSVRVYRIASESGAAELIADVPNHGWFDRLSSELSDSRPFNREHGVLTNGVRLEPRTAADGAPEGVFIDVFAHSSKHGGVNVVVPWTNGSLLGGKTSVGEFDCNGIVNELKREVEPHVNRELFVEES
jgi:hypothetical protein